MSPLPEVSSNFELDAPPGASATGLKAGASGEDDHQVAAEILRDFGLTNAQALARRHHQDNRDDAPGDAEHGERGTQLVRPKCLEYIADEVAENHEQQITRRLDAGPARWLYAQSLGVVQGKRGSARG
jgi:hypothetical protein